MDCPVCSNELKVADRQGIAIEFCPMCRGVWLDRGELEKIIERSSLQAQDEFDEADDEQRDSGRQSYESRGQDRPEGGRREGFFSRLFDFD
jgi:uncharacterized protein